MGVGRVAGRRRPAGARRGDVGVWAQVAITTAAFMAVLTVAIASVGYRLYHDSVMESYVTYADTVLGYAYQQTVEHSLGDMIAERAMPEAYEELRSRLNEVKAASDVEYLYAIYFDGVAGEGKPHYAINAKTAGELSAGEAYNHMGQPVEDEAFESDTLATLRRAVRERRRESGTLEGHSDVYGHMLNGYRVIFDDADTAVGLLCVEIDINRIYAGEGRYVRTVVLVAAALTVLIVLVYLANAQRYLVGPITRIAASSNAFIDKMRRGARPAELVFEDARVTTGGELRVLADDVKCLADGVASYMSNLEAATADRERIATELRMATQIQESALPRVFPAFPDRPEFDLYASMTPAREVGGDFYDFFLVDDDHLCLVIADVSDKGVPAALFMMRSKAVVRQNIMMGKSPAEALDAANASLCEDNDAGMFVTIWVGILQISTGELTASNGGHEYPALRGAHGGYALYRDRHGLIVGALRESRYTDYAITLGPNAMLFVYTDGVPEATNAQGEMFGLDRMVEALNVVRDASPEETIERMRRALDEFVGTAEQFDDLTMLCLEYKGAPEGPLAPDEEGGTDADDE